MPIIAQYSVWLVILASTTATFSNTYNAMVMRRKKNWRIVNRGNYILLFRTFWESSAGSQTPILSVPSVLSDAADL